MDFWPKFEHFLNNRIPKILISLLKNNGYENAFSLKLLNYNTVDYLEKNGLNNTEYAAIYDKLLPGHRASLLALPELVQEFQRSYSDDQAINTNSEDPRYSFILQQLIKTAEKNSDKDPKHRRFSEEIQYFSILLYIMCGKASYEILSNNLPLPQANTVLSYINKKKERITEGELRCEELEKYLTKVKAPKTIWLAEDSSGILSKVTYDSVTNQMVGLVLPIHQETGIPIKYSFTPKSSRDIEEYCKRPKSTLVHIVTAQPLKPNTPPFILQIFGINNKHTSRDIERRWAHTKNELLKFNISVAGISTDGDARPLTCMKYNLMNMSKSEDPLSSVADEQETTYIQDPEHCVTKGRNRILKPSSIFPMGLKQVSASHLKTLIWTTSKDDHGLVMSDICPQDRQNVGSFEKITEKRVLDCLREFVIDSEATVMYLEVFKEVTSAFMEDIPPLDRVYRIWHGLYFLRAWRKWILDSKMYSIKDNFISYSLFQSIEINAYGLLHLITKFRDANQPELFLPLFFSSQTCESTFRQMRSMTTINWTRINFSLQELLHIANRIELMNDIIYYKLAEHNVTFPRLQRKNVKHKIYTLPSNDEIQKVLDQARTVALLDAVKMGMPTSMHDIKICPITRTSLPLTQNIDGLDDDDDDDEENEPGETTLSCNSLRDYTSLETQVNLEENSKFVQVYNEDGSSKTVLKSSIIWLLAESNEKLSQDRLRRVQGVDRAMAEKRNNCKQIASQAKKSRLQDLYLSDTIKIGDWCFFSNKEPSCEKSPFDQIIFGSALSFKYNEGRTEKDRQYSRDYVPVAYDSTNKAETRPRGISVSAKWYKCNDNDLNLQPMEDCNFFIDIENYLATASMPPEILSLDLKSYRVTGNTIELKKKLLELIN